MRTFTACLLSVLLLSPVTATADSSSPRLAAFYDRQMAIVAGRVFAWEGDAQPAPLPIAGRQVGVGRDTFYVLTQGGELVAFDSDFERQATIMRGVAQFAAGDSGILAIAEDDGLWWLSGKRKERIADEVAGAAVGDGANYYITRSGDLFVRGRAHRGQYGDGRLKPTDHFVQTASGVTQITAHTGHAILLRENGDVLGTGGNIYGPVGRHGLGDKAVRWSLIASDAKAIATGSSHSLAILQNDVLIAWGRGYDPEPMPILNHVLAVAAGSRTTIALTADETLWQWDRGQTPRRVSLPRGN